VVPPEDAGSFSVQGSGGKSNACTNSNCLQNESSIFRKSVQFLTSDSIDNTLVCFVVCSVTGHAEEGDAGRHFDHLKAAVWV
jgi:hypothetical protein